MKTTHDTAPLRLHRLSKGWCASCLHDGLIWTTWISDDGRVILDQLPNHVLPDFSETQAHNHMGYRWTPIVLEDYVASAAYLQANL
jgi:hypothetical protein